MNLKLLWKLLSKISETWSIVWWTISSHLTATPLQQQGNLMWSITSGTKRLIQPEQQTTWQTGPVLLGVWGRPSPAERHKLFLPMPLEKQRADSDVFEKYKHRFERLDVEVCFSTHTSLKVEKSKEIKDGLLSLSVAKMCINWFICMFSEKSMKCAPILVA